MERNIRFTRPTLSRASRRRRTNQVIPSVDEAQGDTNWLCDKCGQFVGTYADVAAHGIQCSGAGRGTSPRLQQQIDAGPTPRTLPPASFEWWEMMTGDGRRGVAPGAGMEGGGRPRLPPRRPPRRTPFVFDEDSSPPNGTRNDFIFLGKDGRFEGYFKTDYNPDEKYDPNHLCQEWGECCTKNFNFKPSQLSAAEEDKTNPLNKKKVKNLEGEMKKLKEILLKNLQDEYETPKEAETMIAMMKTYSWLCNELLRVKY